MPNDNQPALEGDDAELAALEAAVAAEEAAKTGQPPAPEGQDTPAGAAEPPAPPPVAPTMIPKARFDEAVQREREARLRAEGELEAYRRLGVQAPAAQPKEAGPDPLAEIDQQLDSIAQKYDAGEITYADMKRQERALERQRDDLLYERESAGPAGGDSLMVKSVTSQLEQQNAWLHNVPKDAIDDLQPAAIRYCRNNNLSLEGPEGDLNMRYAVVQVGKAFGFDRAFAAKGSAPASPPAPTADQPARTTTAGLSPDQLKAKLALANRAPPNPTGVNDPDRSSLSGPKSGDELSEEDIERLTPEQLEAIAPSR